MSPQTTPPTNETCHAPDAKGDAIHAAERDSYQKLLDNLDLLRSDMHRQTFLILGAMGALAAFIAALLALFTFLD